MARCVFSRKVSIAIVYSMHVNFSQCLLYTFSGQASRELCCLALDTNLDSRRMEALPSGMC